MKAYSLKKAKELVSLYNELKSMEETARKTGIALFDVRRILNWLWEYDYRVNPKTRITPFGLPIPDSHVWIRFLYAHDISPDAAAACVGWPYIRVLNSCGGPQEWHKKSGREIEIKPERLAPSVKELTQEELQERMAEVRKTWTDGDRRLREEQPDRFEIPVYSYNPRGSTFRQLS